MVQAATREIREMQIRGYVKWKFTTAVRSAEPWQKATVPPPLLEELNQSMEERVIHVPFVPTMA